MPVSRSPEAWHAVGGNEGFLICEADDPIRLGLWMQDWSDLLKFRVLPVVDDEGVSRVLAGG